MCGKLRTNIVFAALRRANVATVIVLGIAVMSMPGHANQRPFPVAVISCDSDLSLCRAVLQALSQMHSAHLYRINAKPMPPNAFDLRLELSGNNSAKLRWQGSNAGEMVARQGQDDAKFARRIVNSSPGLLQALENHE